MCDTSKMIWLLLIPLLLSHSISHQDFEYRVLSLFKLGFFPLFWSVCLSLSLNLLSFATTTSTIIAVLLLPVTATTSGLRAGIRRSVLISKPQSNLTVCFSDSPWQSAMLSLMLSCHCPRSGSCTGPIYLTGLPDVFVFRFVAKSWTVSWLV